MRKITNLLVVLGVGIITFAILYSLKIKAFSPKETSFIMFVAGELIIGGLFIKNMINKKRITKDKYYSRLIVLSLCFTSIIYYLIINFI